MDEQTIKIKVGLDIGFAGATREDTIDTGFTPAERAAMSDDEWEKICDDQLRDWAFGYIDMWHEEA